MLQAAAWGSGNLPWVTRPPKGAWEQAGELLRELDALDSTGSITRRGKLLASLPLTPRLGHMVIESPDRATAALTAAVLSEGHRFKLVEGTLSDRLMAARSQKKFDSIRRDAESIQRTAQKAIGREQADNRISSGALLSLAFPDRIGRKTAAGSFELTTGASLLCRDCNSNWAVFPEIFGPPERLIGRLAEEITIDEIRAFLPAMFRIRKEVNYLPDSGKFKVSRSVVLGKICLKQLPADAPNREEKLIAVEKEVKKRGIEVLPLSNHARALLSRLRTAHEIGIKGLPSGDFRFLAGSIGQWLGSWLEGELSPALITDALQGRLSWEEKNKLEDLFPRQIEIRPGQKKIIDYTQPGRPTIKGRLQEFYGLTAPVTIAEGKINISVELLSPAMRPLQTTSDIGSFWRGSYQQIRSEMRGRYPKHFWPEDPATSPPSLATGKRRPE
jgi:ATP-dependent helicase HrpB